MSSKRQLRYHERAENKANSTPRDKYAEVIEFEMDPESNWDICPVCLDWLSGGVPLNDWPYLDDFPGKNSMRDYHEEHKARGRDSQ